MNPSLTTVPVQSGMRRGVTGPLRRGIRALLAGVLAWLCCAALSAGEDGSATGKKPWELDTDELRALAFEFAPGRSMAPGTWPGNARVGVLISVDADNESLIAVEDTDPFVSSFYQFAYRRGLERILGVLDRHEIPASVFVPVATLKLTPRLISMVQASGRHEFAVHGWIHEKATDLSAEEQKSLIERSVDEITRMTGVKPVGYRAPYGVVTPLTVPILKELDFLYDSSFVADDRPYELNWNGRPTGLVELPPSLNLEDSLLNPLNNFTGGLLSPADTLASYKSAFDVAYEEGGMLLILMHPHSSGKLTTIGIIEGLIEYAKSHDGVWFGTHRDAAAHFLSQIQ